VIGTFELHNQKHTATRHGNLPAGLRKLLLLVRLLLLLLLLLLVVVLLLISHLLTGMPISSPLLLLFS
jgi:hypothetical protein